MAIVTRKEYAEISGIDAKSIGVYVKRKKLVELSDKRLDTEAPMNKMFIQLRKQKKLTATTKKEKTALKDKSKPPEEIHTQLPPKKTAEEKRSDKENDNLILRKLKADTEKAEADNELKNLQLEKMMGKLIPVDLMHGVIKINIQNIFFTFENDLINIASIYCDKMAGGDRSMLSAVIADIRPRLERLIKETKTNAAKEIEVLIEDYANTRSRGQRQ